MTSERGPREPEDLSELRAELDAVERGVLRQIDPGPKALLIAVAVLALLVAAILPWVGEISGWQVLLGQHDGPVHLVPKLFAGFAFGVGVLLSALTLTMRRWGLAWAAAWGCALTTMLGVLSVWSQQTGPGVHDPGPGPSIGLIVAVLAALVLAVQWFRVAWSRPVE
ncbi:membrane protein [Longimycelium tulufanense]|uniref:Membrane protein n=1 Tax=Longimycelium tulufanense TaxID=907463 RepID=A0A8J3CEB1_9PSEU|nr:hypothetical protein [Longimycelium tulufanense]GGM62044.1 membrane protein [Longimycelium tulufanense]